MENKMPKGIIILANGFEESEAIITIDILRRAKISLDLVSMEKELNVISSGNINVVCDLSYKTVIFNKHIKSLTTKSIVEFFMVRDKLVACICAAPMILGIHGYLKGKKYICFPGCESVEFEGILVDANAVRDGNIITAKAMGATFDFSYLIVEYLLNKESAQKVIYDVYYQNLTK